MTAIATLCSKCGQVETNENHCSFCGGCLAECRALVAGKHARICPSCIAKATMQSACILRDLIDQARAAQKPEPRVKLAVAPLPTLAGVPA